MSTTNPMQGFASMPINLAKFKEYLSACRAKGVTYGYGSKDPTPAQTLPIDFKSIDCSGFVRELIRHATDGKVILPDGSYNQRDWAEAFKDANGQTLKRSAFENTGLSDDRVRLCFYKAPPGKVGHVWCTLNGLSYESHGGVGPSSRAWNDPVLKAICTHVYVLSDAPQVEGETPVKLTEAFERAFTFTLGNEGEYSDDPNDAGGPTKYGITQGVLSAWRGHSVSSDDVKALTLSEAKAIYKKNYWDILSLDQVTDSDLALALFDIGVNMGPGTSLKLFQRASGLPETGKMDTATLSKAGGRPALIGLICAMQDRYVEIVKGNSSQMVFLAGWINRSQRLMTVLG